MRSGDALGKACMAEPSAYRQTAIPDRSKRVMQLDVQVQVTFEWCGLRVNNRSKGDHQTNEIGRVPPGTSGYSGVPEATPISNKVLPAAVIAARISSAFKAPMQPILKLSATVSLPG